MRALLSLPRIYKNIIVLLIDVIISIFSTWSSISLRTEQVFIPQTISEISIFFICIVIFLFVFYFYNIYKFSYRHIGINSLKSIISSIFIYLFVLSFITIYISIPEIPRSIGFIQSIIFLVLIIITRLMIISIINKLIVNRATKNIIIYGANEIGIQTAELLKLSQKYSIICFIDNENSQLGQIINGIKVFSYKEIKKIINKNNIDEILVAIPSKEKNTKQKILNFLSTYKIKVKILPDLDQIIARDIKIDDYKDIEVEDLMQRPIKINTEGIKEKIEHKTVLISGGGGSIGSELCIQAIKFNPKKIIIIDHSEYNIYTINKKLKEIQKRLNLYNTEIITILMSVTNKKRMQTVFFNHKPDIIFHAAAYKHVNIVQNNAIEAISNNIFGTINIIDLAIENNCSQFTLISTDKAVNPKNIMGATKRVGEIYLKYCANHNLKENSTKLSIVRFGNVLGSSGSVVPLFKEQIKNGGPITITHPEVTRYFMIIPEAINLIMQSITMAEGGEIFVLQMGESIKILELAEKMVALSGYSIKSEMSPEGDIEIVYTSLEPGEKMEEILISNDDFNTTINKDIIISKEKNEKTFQILNLIEDLNIIVKDNNEKNLIQTFNKYGMLIDN